MTIDVTTMIDDDRWSNHLQHPSAEAKAQLARSSSTHQFCFGTCQRASDSYWVIRSSAACTLKLYSNNTTITTGHIANNTTMTTYYLVWGLSVTYTRCMQHKDVHGDSQLWIGDGRTHTPSLNWSCASLWSTGKAASAWLRRLNI